VFASHLEDGNSVTHEIADGHGAYLYVLQGRIDVNGERMGSGDAAYVWEGGRLELSATVPSELLLVDTAMWRSTVSRPSSA
jgi:redox-sensitive bicupin YhaK (pirin superfamily)